MNDHPSSTAISTEPGFHGDIELNDGHMSGVYVLMPGIICAYSAHDQTLDHPDGSPPRYAVRGSVRLLDAAGHIFRSQATPTLTAAAPKSETAHAEDSTPPKSARYRPQQKAVNIPSKDGKVICAAIVEKAQALVEENAAYIFSEIDKAKPVSQMCLALLFRLQLRRYFGMLAERSVAVSEETRHDRELRIKKIASGPVGLRPLGEITASELKQVSKEIGKNWRDYFKEVAVFVDFLYLRKHDSNPINAFRDYLTAHPERKQMNAKKLQKDAASSDVLTPEMDRRFYEDVLANITDGGMIGVAIVRSTGFNAKQACDLKWEQVRWQDEEHTQALILFSQPDKAGRVQNYNFVLSPCWSSVFRLREQWLIQNGYQPEDFPIYVASNVKDPAKKLQPKELTAICRELAHRYGMSYATLSGLKELENGAGIRVFQATRRYSLEESGMKHDPGLLRFYLHDSLSNNTQANNYRNLSGELAQHLATVYLMRADLILTDAVPNTGRIIRIPNSDGEVVIILPPDTHSKVQGTITLQLKQGDVIQISGPNGVRVCVKALPEQSRPNSYRGLSGIQPRLV